MTFRSDVSVIWAQSPRIIEVAAPSTSITIQDLVDTCRVLESELDALDDDFLIYATGKDECGDITVGITLILNNALLRFEARAPSSWVLCTASGGNLGAIDDVGDPMSPVAPSDYTTVVIAQSTSPSIVYASGGDPAAIADAVWDEAVTDHLGGDKAGQYLKEASEGGDPSAVADAVWDELRSEHTDTGTYGKVDEWAGTGGGLTTEEHDKLMATANESTLLATQATVNDIYDILNMGEMIIPMIEKKKFSMDQMETIILEIQKDPASPWTSPTYTVFLHAKERVT